MYKNLTEMDSIFIGNLGGTEISEYPTTMAHNFFEGISVKKLYKTEDFHKSNVVQSEALAKE